MAKRPCRRNGCAQLVVRGYCDGCSPTYSAAARYEAKRSELKSTVWYNSARWRKMRAGYFARHPLCVDPYRVHAPGVALATDLDHKVPHKEDFVLFWDHDNLQGLCHSCHSTKTVKEDGGFGLRAWG
jgi:5-methylcytosine-specific restriction enzyme A